MRSERPLVAYRMPYQLSARSAKQAIVVENTNNTLGFSNKLDAFL